MTEQSGKQRNKSKTGEFKQFNKEYSHYNPNELNLRNLGFIFNEKGNHCKVSSKGMTHSHTWGKNDYMPCKECCGKERGQEQGTSEKVTRVVQERDSSGMSKSVIVKMRS